MSEPINRPRGQFMMSKKVKTTLDQSDQAFKDKLYSALEELAQYGRTESDIGRRVIDEKMYRIAEIGGKHLVYRPLDDSEKMSPEADRYRDVFLLFDIT